MHRDQNLKQIINLFEIFQSKKQEHGDLEHLMGRLEQGIDLLQSLDGFLGAQGLDIKIVAQTNEFEYKETPFIPEKE